MTVTLADQQGGTGVTVHTDTVAVSLSREKVCLFCDELSCIESLLYRSTKVQGFFFLFPVIKTAHY